MPEKVGREELARQMHQNRRQVSVIMTNQIYQTIFSLQCIISLHFVLRITIGRSLAWSTLSPHYHCTFTLSDDDLSSNINNQSGADKTAGSTLLFSPSYSCHHAPILCILVHYLFLVHAQVVRSIVTSLALPYIVHNFDRLAQLHCNTDRSYTVITITWYVSSSHMECSFRQWVMAILQSCTQKNYLPGVVDIFKQIIHPLY